MLVYIVIVCIVFLALRDFGGRRFISTVLLLYYYYYYHMQVRFMRLMSKLKYLIMPKGTKFTRLGELWFSLILKDKNF